MIRWPWFDLSNNLDLVCHLVIRKCRRATADCVNQLIFSVLSDVGLLILFWHSHSQQQQKLELQIQQQKNYKQTNITWWSNKLIVKVEFPVGKLLVSTISNSQHASAFFQNILSPLSPLNYIIIFSKLFIVLSSHDATPCRATLWPATEDCRSPVSPSHNNRVPLVPALRLS